MERHVERTVCGINFLPEHSERHVYHDVLRLADAVDAIRALILNRRIPPALEMYDMVCGRERQPGACGTSRQDDRVESGSSVLEFGHYPLTSCGRHGAVDFARHVVETVAGANRTSNNVLHVEVLDEDHNLLATGSDVVKYPEEGRKPPRIRDHRVGELHVFEERNGREGTVG